MILNVLVVLLLVAITLLWGMRGRGRGVFSSFLTFVCVVISGAVAFGLWETLTYKVLINVQEDMAWGLGLIIPFCVTLLLTRLIADLAVPKNLDLGDVENFVGGAAFGLASAVITVGIIVLSLGFFRVGPGLLGYQPVVDRNGNLVYERSLWVPVDELTVAFYEHLSRGAFSTPDPLARRMPRLYEHAAMQRMVYVDGTADGAIARNTIKGDQFQIVGRYQTEAGAAGDLATFATVNAEGRPEEKKQNVLDAKGDPVSGTVRVEGFVVRFTAGAGEKSGQVVVGPGQVRLIGERQDGEPFAAHPFSIVATPEAGSGRMHRFPINANELFIPSVGGASTSYFSFEFLVPQGAEVSDLVIKNYRVPASELPDAGVRYASAAQRDEAIATGELFESFGVTIGGINLAELDRSDSVTIRPDERGNFEEIITNAMLPESWVVATTTGTKGLEITEIDNDKAIAGGQGTFTIEDLRQRGLDRNLRVGRFATKRDTTIVQLRIKSRGTPTTLGRAIQASDHDGPPRLLDERGRIYEAIGWVYGDSGTVNIRFSPGDPLENLAELPSALSDTKRDQTLYLVFQPTKGVTVTGFLLGKHQIAEFAGGQEAR